MLILAFFLALLPATFAHTTNCYTCSFSPKDATNWTRQCKDDEFEGNAVAITACDHGCQRYVHTDSNGVFEQIRRSCAQPNSGIEFGSCKTEETQAYKSVRCICNTDLCNTASSLYSYFGVISLTLLFMLWNFHHF